LFRIQVPTEKDKFELSELGRMFAPADEFEFLTEEDSSGSCPKGILPSNSLSLADGCPPLGQDPKPVYKIPAADKNQMKRELYSFLSRETGKELDWGILTGVRPGKLYNMLCEQYGQPEAERRLKSDYYLSEGKLSLLRNVHRVQQTVLQDSRPNAIGVYVGIPFCPTRCLYCSFTSNRITKEAATAYLAALFDEISRVSDIMKNRGLFAESIYIGGGTPTSLDEEDFQRLLQHVRDAFVRKESSEFTKEFTVEAGRPDTITEAKLQMIREYGAERISINPQSMKARTMELIGRSHSPEQIVEAFALAKKVGVPIINMDLIAGLPEEEPEDFADSLDKVIGLGPQNITVHTLAVKRASRLIEESPGYNYNQGEKVRKMLQRGAERLSEASYEPYYLYRQKQQTGNFENVGYALPGTASLYNIRIMEENQTILAMGAGAISKVYYASRTQKLNRIPNVSNYQIYIERIDEMIQRKEEALND
jgi:oxygen-independent coproporphyrinogen-3 oxidase